MSDILSAENHNTIGMGPSANRCVGRERLVSNTDGDGTCPVAREDDLVVTDSAEEMLVYDERVHALHTLNPLAKAIWRNCDGLHDAQSITAKCSTELAGDVSERDVQDGLRLLADLDLLQGWPETHGPLGTRSSRRKVLKRTTVAGAAIVSVTAPLATAHASGCAKFDQECGPDMPCCTEGACSRPAGGGVCQS